MMKMREKKTVSVDAGQIVDFSPGALHLMIFNVKAPLVEGNTTKFELQTDRCGDYPVELDIRSPLRPKMKDHH
jgi:copper(I)-binding protein